MKIHHHDLYVWIGFFALSAIGGCQESARNEADWDSINYAALCKEQSPSSSCGTATAMDMSGPSSHGGHR